MTAIKQQAVAMIQAMPDENVSCVINILKGIKGLASFQSRQEDDLEKKQKALANLQQYRGKLPIDLDYKKELAETREEKYR